MAAGCEFIYEKTELFLEDSLVLRTFFEKGEYKTRNRAVFGIAVLDPFREIENESFRFRGTCGPDDTKERPTNGKDYCNDDPVSTCIDKITPQQCLGTTGCSLISECQGQTGCACDENSECFSESCVDNVCIDSSLTKPSTVNGTWGYDCTRDGKCNDGLVCFQPNAEKDYKHCVHDQKCVPAATAASNFCESAQDKCEAGSDTTCGRCGAADCELTYGCEWNINSAQCTASVDGNSQALVPYEHFAVPSTIIGCDRTFRFLLNVEYDSNTITDREYVVGHKLTVVVYGRDFGPAEAGKDLGIHGVLVNIDYDAKYLENPTIVQAQENGTVTQTRAAYTTCKANWDQHNLGRSKTHGRQLRGRRSHVKMLGNTYDCSQHNGQSMEFCPSADCSYDSSTMYCCSNDEYSNNGNTCPVTCAGNDESTCTGPLSSSCEYDSGVCCSNDEYYNNGFTCPTGGGGSGDGGSGGGSGSCDPDSLLCDGCGDETSCSGDCTWDGSACSYAAPPGGGGGDSGCDTGPGPTCTDLGNEDPSGVACTQGGCTWDSGSGTCTGTPTPVQQACSCLTDQESCDPTRCEWQNSECTDRQTCSDHSTCATGERCVNSDGTDTGSSRYCQTLTQTCGSPTELVTQSFGFDSWTPGTDQSGVLAGVGGSASDYKPGTNTLQDISEQHAL